MSSFYLDNDVFLRLVPLLVAGGHAVSSARELGLASAGDEAQLLTAVRREAILVTYNRRDFELLHDAWITWPAAFDLDLPAHPGILALAHAPVADQFDAIDGLIETTAPSALQNTMYSWRPGRGWERRAT